MSILLSSGSNAHGQLSNGLQEDSHEFRPCSFYGCPPGELPPNTRRVKHIASGANHTLILLENYDHSSELWGCGDSKAGQMGAVYREEIQAGKSSAIFRPVDLPLEQDGLEHHRIKAIAAAWETTYIALSDADRGDVVISMGSDDFGDLGIGGSKKGKETQTASFHVVRFDHLTIDGLPVNTKSIVIRSLAAGQHHVVVHLQASLSNGSIRLLTVGWGTSRHGQLGNMNTQSTKMPPFVSIPHVVSSDDLKDPTVSISLGNQHTTFLRASGKVAGMGSNRKGQLHGIDVIEGVTKLGCTWNGTYVFLKGEDGNVRVLATGSYSHGQLGRALHDSSGLPSIARVDLRLLVSPHRLIDMACGSEHVLVLVSVDDESVEVWGWGWNEHGNLGTGLIEDVLIPVRVWAKDLGAEVSQKAAGIWAGSGTSWIYVTT